MLFARFNETELCITRIMETIKIYGLFLNLLLFFFFVIYLHFVVRDAHWLSLTFVVTYGGIG